MKNIFILVFLLLGLKGISQENTQIDSISLLFIGDIMGHETQIKSAYDPVQKTYNYHNVFAKVSPIIERYDFTIANLEVTLAGPPYEGYPQFSSPTSLAQACIDNGIDVFVTSNNHACDKGKKGVIKTIKTLDSLAIPHTGTFLDSADRAKRNLLILEKNGIKVGILNYTYGTNNIPDPKPTIVNRLERDKIIVDIQDAKNDSLDKLIVFVHWGKEYKLLPNTQQKELAEYLFVNGVDIIIGSHPHVLQPMEFHPATEEKNERLIVYSLGNYVSNQRAARKDGGAMLKLTLSKQGDNVKIKNCGYHLTWVHKPKVNGKTKFEILPCKTYEANEYEGLNEEAKAKMKIFTTQSRKLLNTYNKAVPELK